MLPGVPQIGRYRVLHLLGRGGMGDVYLAGAKGVAGFEKAVALKVLRPHGGHVGAMLREAFIGVSLDHQDLVQVLDLGEHEGRYFIVMEYVRGFTLGHVLHEAKTRGVTVPLGTILHVVRHVADALEYVHSLGDGIVHRDVSPSNVLLGTDGRVKLSDFGVAAFVNEAGGGFLTGKPDFLPPEAFRGAQPAQAWDVYALGAVLWEALAGRAAFAGDSMAAVRAAVLAGPPRLHDARGYPRAVLDVAERAVDPDPARRFATAAELRDALAEVHPPEVRDAELHRRYMSECYASPGFIARHGELPDTRELLGRRDLTPPPMMDVNAPTMAREPIRIGLSQAGGSGWARGEGERLAARLGSVLGRPAVPVVVADYRALIDCLASGALDLAWMPPAAFVEAERQGARALAVSSRLGKTTYHSAIIARDDSAIATLEDLRGQSIAWVDRDSASGYLFAMAEIVRALGTPEKALGRQRFVGSHRAVCEAVADGWAAAGATYAILDDDGRLQTSGWHERLGPRAGEIKVVAYTRRIPGDNVACRPGLDSATADQIAAALVDLAGDEVGRAILHDVFRAEALVAHPGDIYADVRTTVELLRGVPLTGSPPGRSG